MRSAGLTQVQHYTGTGFVAGAAKYWNGTAWVAANAEYNSDIFCVKTWLNHASGVGARNGASSHTIGGASASAGCVLPFVPAAGSLLVALVAGAVTNTSSGWVEREQPVNSNELSLFTKTASGNDFLTVTHNGSNYPINWAVYEFAAGSTYTKSIGVTASTDVFPALGGLPGTQQFVLAAYCRGFPPSGSVTGGSTVTSPWVEDSDSLTPNGPTDNNYLYVFHQPGVTAISVTPVFTKGIAGTMNTDRQKIVAAFTLT
jgi:hypothetical protein